MSSQRGSPNASIVGGPATGFSSGRAIAFMEEIARETLPPGAAHEWTAMSYQEKAVGSQVYFVFALAILLVYFVLAGEAARLRLRPIPMTSFAFILGVRPLVFATGGSARKSIGIAVASDMLASTILGVVFLPAFYVVLQRLGERLHKSERGKPADRRCRRRAR